jgi:hypothetical protein
MHRAAQDEGNVKMHSSSTERYREPSTVSSQDTRCSTAEDTGCSQDALNPGRLEVKITYVM